MPDPNPLHGEDTLTKEESRAQKPRMYKVILHNDDYTPMDFVTMVLVEVFHKTEPEAIHIMLAVHRRGHGLAGVYSREVAETKVQRVRELAKAHEFPLQCSMEPD